MENKVLFNFLENYVVTYPQKEMLFAKQNGHWKGLTSNEVYEQSLQLANSLINLGITGNDNSPEGKDKIAVMSNNRPEWIVLDFAVQQTGAALIPIYPSIIASELEFVLKASESKVLFISDKTVFKKVEEIRQNVPSLRYVFCFDEVEACTSWASLLKPYTEQELSKINSIKHQVKPEHLATIIYTSGTTGNPKGVMLSHNNLVSNAMASLNCFGFCTPSDRALSFLPLNHIFERIITYIYLTKGISIYYAEGMEKIADNLKEVKPAVFTTVPRLLEKVYEKIEGKKQELKGVAKKIYDWAFNIADNFEINKSKNIFYKLKYNIADKLIFKKWREAIGGEVKAIITGSAACQIRLMRLFTAGKIVIMEGYGLTETSPVITVNRFEEKNRKFGSVGKVIEGVTVKIANDGEILCQGPNVMMGYYKEPQKTDEVIKDNWFYTGDIGELDAGGFLKITDRKKELFKLSAGKYIAPLPIESKMKESNFIEQIMIVGNNEKFVGALIVPSFNNIINYFKEKGRELKEKADIVKDADVLKLIRAELNNMNKNFNDYEHVKKFKLLLSEWTVDSGELTPKLSVKRRVIFEKYKNEISEIFN